MNRIYTAATKVALLSASVAVTTLCIVATPIVWAQVNGNASVSVSELTRLASCDEAQRLVARFQAEQAAGTDTAATLDDYWPAQRVCAGTATAQAAR